MLSTPTPACSKPATAENAAADFEFDLLISCLRGRFQRRPDFPEGAQPDWTRLLQFADWHRVAPLLCRVLSQFGDAPTWACADLRLRVQRILRRNLALSADLLKILRLLQQHGITAVPYKGPALALLAYGSLDSRISADLDVLVRRAQIPQACDVLIAAGYAPDVALRSWEQRIFFRSEFEFTLWSPDRSFQLELHWDLAPRYFAYNLPWDKWWSELTTVRLGGSDVPSLAPENLVLALCVHGGKHMWSRLSLACDLAALLSSCPQVDLGRVHAEARALRLERVLLLGLAAAQLVAPVAMPAEIAARWQNDSAGHHLLAEIRSQWPLCAAHSEKGELRRLFFLLRLRKNWRDKLRCLWRVVTTPGAEDLVHRPVPRALVFALPALRVARLLRRLPAALR